MAKCSGEVIYEGWLTKSPPTKRIWRGRWRKRWFLLTQAENIPGQYILTYYTNRNCSKHKGVINLDHCEQVDLGLTLVERKFDHVFGIKTPNRTYYLAADTEEEMKSWVSCICQVCGLKSTNEEEDCMPMNSPDIEITEEVTIQSTSLSSTNNRLYIPISECITGKSPVFDPRDFKSIQEYNQHYGNHLVAHSNNSYEHHSSSYVNLGNDPDRNYVNDMQDPSFYDSPRPLLSLTHKNKDTSCHSPLQSPTDSDNVFIDDLIHNSNEIGSLKNLRSSNSSTELNHQKYGGVVDGAATLPPPRPPKPSHIKTPLYLNLSPTPLQIRKELEEPVGIQKVISDDMYDFPRSHNVDAEQNKNTTLHRRHCYNNAAPTQGPEGIIFQYDITPKPTGSVNSVFRYDTEATQNMEPSSPAHSHSSSTPAYSNLPSPLITGDSSVMPPPTVNRYLKPKRKKSETLSTSSTNEPPSPRSLAPSVDRKLKPPTPSHDTVMKKYSPEEDGSKRRAAPSPTPPGITDNMYENQDEAYHYVTNHLQYLDLVLEPSSPSSTSAKTTPSQSTTVYKHVDFIKTQAFNITRNNLVKERQEPVTTFVKK